MWDQSIIDGIKQLLGFWSMQEVPASEQAEVHTKVDGCVQYIYFGWSDIGYVTKVFLN